MDNIDRKIIHLLQSNARTLFAFVSQKELFSTMVPVGLVLGIGVGLVGSLLTTRKHLRV